MLILDTALQCYYVLVFIYYQVNSISVMIYCKIILEIDIPISAILMNHNFFYILKRTSTLYLCENIWMFWNPNSLSLALQAGFKNLIF